MSSIPFSERRFVFVFSAWWLLWSAMQVWILYKLEFSWQTAAIDSLLSNFLLSASCVLISNNLKYYLPQRQRYWYLLALCVLTAGAWLLAIRYAIPYVMPGNDPGYLSFFTRSLPVRFGIAFLAICCMAMISVLWYGFEDQKITARRKSEAEQLTKDAELYKLRQQLQPHFLFNSLNSINALIGTRPQEARSMVQQLSEFLRGTLKREEQQWMPLEEELQYLRLYLDIERVRFGNRLSVEFDTPENTMALRIPAMILQPLVENAIKFGLYDTTGDTSISIRTALQNQVLEITVQNPYDPETAQPRRGTGFGLHSIERRLYLLFARKDLLRTSASLNIFTTQIIIPQPELLPEPAKKISA